MLTGPYPINEIDLHVSQTGSGVYVLSKDGKTAAYVGRSDTDVGSRIKQSLSERNGYSYFWFEYTPSSRDAFLKECEHYHKYNPPHNSNHPAAPFGTNWKCPVIGCPWS